MPDWDSELRRLTLEVRRAAERLQALIDRIAAQRVESVRKTERLPERVDRAVLSRRTPSTERRAPNIERRAPRAERRR